MIPLARTNNLLITQVGEEVIVYDRERDTAHCLNAMAARVWHYCDGQNTVEDIAKLLEEDLEVSADEDVDWRGLVWLTLEELERFYLIQEYLSQPISSEVQSADALRVSRRKMIKTATLVGGFAIGSMFPLVKSIVAPAPGMAAPGSPTPTPTLISLPRGKCDSGFSFPLAAVEDTIVKAAKELDEIEKIARRDCISKCPSRCLREFVVGETTYTAIVIPGEIPVEAFEGLREIECVCSSTGLGIGGF